MIEVSITYTLDTPIFIVLNKVVPSPATPNLNLQSLIEFPIKPINIPTRDEELLIKGSIAIWGLTCIIQEPSDATQTALPAEFLATCQIIFLKNSNLVSGTNYCMIIELTNSQYIIHVQSALSIIFTIQKRAIIFKP